jgi:peptidyl-prolyl cis-trans isomerase B (cyclophilin B)
VRGAVAMARFVSPDTAGSQFYIMLANAAELDGQYTVFGKVTSGMDVVDKIVRGDKMKTVKIVEADQ